MFNIKMYFNNVIRFSLVFLNLILCALISLNLIFLINIKLNKTEIPQHFKISFFCINNDLLYPDLMYNNFVLTKSVNNRNTMLVQDDFVVFYDDSSILAGKIVSENSEDDSNFSYFVKIKNNPDVIVDVRKTNIIGKVVLRLDNFGQVIRATQTYFYYVVLLFFVILFMTILLICKF